MRYFIFYKAGTIIGKGCSISLNNIEEWLHQDGTREVTADEFNRINIQDYKTFHRVRYRLQYGVCTHCKSDYTESEQWCDEHEINLKHLCGNCQIGTLPVIQILSICSI